MAMHGATTGVYAGLFNSGSISLDTDSICVLCLWYKPSSASSGSRGIAQLGETNSPNNNDHGHIYASSDTAMAGRAYDNATAFVTCSNSGTMNVDAWNRLTLAYGPFDGTAQAVITYLNGDKTTAAQTGSDNTATIDTVLVGTGLNTWGYTSDRFAHAGICNAASVSAVDTIHAAMATTATKDSSGMAHAWDLIDDLTADLGGVDLGQAGTVSFDSDESSFGAAPAVSRGQILFL